MTKEQILSLLTDTESAQMIFLVANDIIHNEKGDKGEVVITESLPDLAFRLRDEVNETDQTRRAFIDALYTIQEHLGETDWATSYWGLNLCQPIHWIVAALLAKENEK